MQPDPSRHMLLLSLTLGPRLDALKRQGVRWRYDQAGGTDARGVRHMGLLVIEKAKGAMLVKMAAPDRIELWAEGVGNTRGAMSYEPSKVTADFVMRAVGRFMERCGRA